MPESYDLVVIGGGPGGYAAALYAGAAGLSVAVVEKGKVGGTCLHRGCIPAKEFLETANVYRTVSDSETYGIGIGKVAINFAKSAERKRSVVSQLHKGLQGLMKKRKVTTYEGTGSLAAGNTVRIQPSDGTDVLEIVGRNVILASGSVPRTIPGFEPDGKSIMTSDEFLDIERIPASAVVIGGGAIGCEFASMLSDMGAKVTLIEALPTLLPGCDADIAAVVSKSFERRGIDVFTGTQVTGQTPKGGVRTTVAFGVDKEVTVEAVVVAIGRKPFSEGLVFPSSGVEIDERGFVKVDELMRTTASGVYAVGDIVDSPQLAHVGFAEAIVAVKDILGEQPQPVDYAKVPWCIYSHPEVAFAGYSEQAAKEAGFEVKTEKIRMVGNSRGIILGETDGMVKLIAQRKPDGGAGKLLGVHMAGPWATEQLGQGYLAVNWEALPEEIAQFIQPHPTLSESFGEAVMALAGRGLHG